METLQSESKSNVFAYVLDKLCLTPMALVGLIILVVIPFIPPFNQQYLIRWLVAAALMAANAIAFDFTAGYINIVNFGYYAILGLGGYTSAILANNLGISPWIGMFFGAAASGILGFLTGLLTLKLRGLFCRRDGMVCRPGTHGSDHQTGMAHTGPAGFTISAAV